DTIAQQVDQEQAENGDQVPLDAHAPLYTATQQLSHTRSARDDGGDDQGCQGRPSEGKEDTRDIKRTIWERVGEEAQPIHSSGECEGQQGGPASYERDDEVGQQGMLTDKPLER